MLTGDYLAQGGRDYANKLLVKAFGEDGAQELLRQASLTAEESASKLDSLRKVGPATAGEVHRRGAPANHRV